MATRTNGVTVLTPKVEKIVIGERRRKDLGNIGELAENIDKRGLLHPIVVTDEDGNGNYHLIAGGRRMAAVTLLGWTNVPARLLGTLTEAERREIELEENTHRKDLTRDEALRTFELAKQVLRDRDENEGDLSPQLRRKIGRGRPSKPDSDEKAAVLANISLDTVKRHQQHASAEERYPVLKTVPTQADALKIAAKLDAMPEPVRAETIEKLERQDSDTQAAMTDRPPVPKGPSPHEMAANDPERKWARILHDITRQLSSTRNNGGIGMLTRKWSANGKRSYLAEIRRIKDELTGWEEYLSGEVEHDEHVA